jgi:hypothetical protein
MSVLPDNLKTLSIGDIVHIYVNWGNITYFDNDAEVVDYLETTGLVNVKLKNKDGSQMKNPDGSDLIGQFGLWAITKIVKESPNEPEIDRLKKKNEELNLRLEKLRELVSDIHSKTDIFGL